MATNTLTAITELIALAPKASAFLAGSPVDISVPAESYTVNIPDIGDVKVSEPGLTVTIQKVA